MYATLLCVFRFAVFFIGQLYIGINHIIIGIGYVTYVLSEISANIGFNIDPIPTNLEVFKIASI